MEREIIVEKIDGTLEPFSEKKYRFALERSGLTPTEIDEVIAHITARVGSKITTKELYKQTFDYLETMRSVLACRYSLKRALIELGPSGFPFEQFMKALFEAQGYTVSTGVTIAGKCVSHEVDVVASKGDDRFFIECKFHNKQRLRSRIKDPLYIKARFDDICLAYESRKHGSLECRHGMLVTNTKFSSDVLAYGPCAGIKLLSWNYPRNASLAALIDRHNLHPITCLTSLSNADKQALLKHDIILCRHIHENQKKVQSIIRNKKRVVAMLEQIEGIITS